MSQKTYIWIAIGVITFFLIILGVWFFFFRSSASTATPITTLFGTSVNNTTTSTSNTNTSATTNGTLPASQQSTQKIFEIAQGPIAGATLIQTLHPTTTLARYVNQEDGHVYDMPLDVAGAVSRVVSNVTIPSIEQVVWLEQGNAAILQYIDTDNTTIKSVYLGLPAATTSTKLAATRIQFLPDNIVSLAASPDGKSVAYLLKTSGGSSGYMAKSDGTGAKKLFSLPLAQVLIQWPAQNTLLAQTKSTTGVPGMAFSIDVKTGAVTPLIYADGLTVIADSTFSNVVYQTTEPSASTQSTYVHNIKNGTNIHISLNPFTEQCIFSHLFPNMFYCSVPEQNVAVNFLDLWHQGEQSEADGISLYSTSQANSTLIATPGSSDGGVASDILEMALSPDEHYLSFTTKGTRELWGVRLAQ